MPSTVAEGLAAAASSSLVTVKAVDNALYIEATTTGSATNYPYFLSATNVNPTLFHEPSFVSSSIGGQLDGGAAQAAEPFTAEEAELTAYREELERLRQYVSMGEGI